jgi:hypothetical protein
VCLLFWARLPDLFGFGQSLRVCLPFWARLEGVFRLQAITQRCSLASIPGVLMVMVVQMHGSLIVVASRILLAATVKENTLSRGCC